MDFKNLNFNLFLSIFLVLVIIGFSAYNNEEHFFIVNKIANGSKTKVSKASRCSQCNNNKKQQWTEKNPYCSCN